jgi:hypothetical protein
MIIAKANSQDAIKCPLMQKSLETQLTSISEPSLVATSILTNAVFIFHFFPMAYTWLAILEKEAQQQLYLLALL